MKKVILFAAASLFVLASCKKDYTCSCKGDDFSIDVPIQDAKKKDAESACDAAQTTYKNADSTIKCELK